MIKKLLLSVVCAVVLLGGLLNAYTYGVNPPLYANIDVVYQQHQPVIAGWALDQNTGHRPSSIVVFRLDNATGQGQFVPALISWGSRPDVAAAFGLTDTILGYGIIMSWTPPGDYTYSLLISDAPYSQQSLAPSSRVVIP